MGVRAEGWGWRHASRAAWTLRDLTFRIEPGERVLLLGASGAGKSTLLQAIAGVLGADDDTQSEDGESWGSLLVDGRSAVQSRGSAGLILQDPDSQVILARAGDDVAFGCENLGVPRDQIWPRVRHALAEVGLNIPLDRSTSELSGGQKQRLALAGVLAMRPGLLLLDEPTANLDPSGVLDVRDAVARVVDDTRATLIVVEHRVDVWMPLVDRIIVVSPGGGVVADGEPETVLKEQGPQLARAGVWVPEYPPSFPVRRATPGAVLLTARDVTVGRGSSKKGAGFLRGGLTVEVREGTTTAITGPNGSGKTTLGLTLAGLFPPVAGTVVASNSLSSGAGEHPFTWKSRALLTRIGTVFQEPEHQFLTSTVRQELAVGPRALGLSQADITARVDELLQRLRLAALAEANPFTLSGGEKRRLSVGTVLATSPRVLVLDEPTFGQDSCTWQELLRILAEQVADGRAVVAMTHDQLFVEALADREMLL